MSRFNVCFAIGALLITSQARAESPARDKKVGLCEKAGGAIATAGAVVSGVPAAAAAAGVAAVPQAGHGGPASKRQSATKSRDPMRDADVLARARDLIAGGSLRQTATKKAHRELRGKHATAADVKRYGRALEDR